MSMSLSVTVAVAVASCFILLATTVVGAPPADLVVAFSPGAQDTMMLLALALQLDPVFVGAHHLARYVIVSMGVPFAAHAIIRREARAASPPEGEAESRQRPGEGRSATFPETPALPPPPDRRCRGGSTSPIEGEGR